MNALRIHRPAALIAALAVFIAAAAHGASSPVWVAYPEEGRILCCLLRDGSMLGPSVVASGGAAECPPAIASRAGLPAVAWLDRDGGILFSAYDGRAWSAAELVSGFRGRHRGLPTLAIGAVA
ncbi:MAG: hypothetical protein NT045_03530 [Candidatus Aureabacteria bacterium]|nr:hypothetical protein [Candidatus Auribacterota bacterium]